MLLPAELEASLQQGFPLAFLYSYFFVAGLHILSLFGSDDWLTEIVDEELSRSITSEFLGLSKLLVFLPSLFEGLSDEGLAFLWFCGPSSSSNIASDEDLRLSPDCSHSMPLRLSTSLAYSGHRCKLCLSPQLGNMQR